MHRSALAPERLAAAWIERHWRGRAARFDGLAAPVEATEAHDRERD